jgi:hypothetical protein
MESIKQILIIRDGMSSEEAEEHIKDLKSQISAGEIDIEEALEELGLEPDYILELL